MMMKRNGMALLAFGCHYLPSCMRYDDGSVGGGGGSRYRAFTQGKHQLGA